MSKIKSVLLIEYLKVKNIQNQKFMSKIEAIRLIRESDISKIDKPFLYEIIMDNVRFGENQIIYDKVRKAINKLNIEDKKELLNILIENKDIDALLMFNKECFDKNNLRQIIKTVGDSVFTTLTNLTNLLFLKLEDHMDEELAFEYFKNIDMKVNYYPIKNFLRKNNFVEKCIDYLTKENKKSHMEVLRYMDESIEIKNIINLVKLLKDNNNTDSLLLSFNNKLKKNLEFVLELEKNYQNIVLNYMSIDLFDSKEIKDVIKEKKFYKSKKFELEEVKAKDSLNLWMDFIVENHEFIYEMPKDYLNDFIKKFYEKDSGEVLVWYSYYPLEVRQDFNFFKLKIDEAHTDKFQIRAIENIFFNNIDINKLNENEYFIDLLTNLIDGPISHKLNWHKSILYLENDMFKEYVKKNLESNDYDYATLMSSSFYQNLAEFFLTENFRNELLKDAEKKPKQKNIKKF